MEELTEFERRVRLVAPYFNGKLRRGKDILPPPFIVEFLGTPSGGKSTLIRELDKFLKRQGFRIWHPQEGAEAVRYLDRTTPFYNLATGLYAYKILMQESEGHQYDFVLFERCVFDAYTWMKYWNKKGHLSNDMMRMLQESFLMGAPRIDCACIVISQSDVAMRRETKNELTRTLGNHTRPEVIQFLYECNMESYEELKGSFPNLFLFDTTSIEEKEMVQKAARIMLDVLEKKIIAVSSE
ncbi:MAG: hypothetical protein HYZ69_01745 [Candidatus Colwellbacteria bacterium]|nr:hypothetical protein [Candidatus Colwellbacteria bacterium]